MPPVEPASHAGSTRPTTRHTSTADKPTRKRPDHGVKGAPGTQNTAPVNKPGSEAAHNFLAGAAVSDRKVASWLNEIWSEAGLPTTSDEGRRLQQPATGGCFLSIDVTVAKNMSERW
jgi:hypothetical protein